MDLVQVAVPADRLIEVYALLGTTKALAAAAPNDSTNGNKPWTEKALARLLGEASKTIRGEAKYLASRPEQEVTTDDIAKALKLKYGWNSLAGANGAWGRKLGNRGYAFPWSSYYASDGLSRLTMTAEMAALVNKVV